MIVPAGNGPDEDGENEDWGGGIIVVVVVVG